MELPLQKSTKGIMTRYALKLNLLGCGNGGTVASSASVAGRDSMMGMQSVLLTGGSGMLQPEQRMVSRRQTMRRGKRT